MIRVDCVLDAKAMLGEAAMWDEQEQALWWADIDGKSLHRFDPETGHDRVWDLPQRVGCFAFRKSGGFLLALQNGFHFFDPVTKVLDAIVDPEADRVENRFNDGTPDPVGRFVAGTMPTGPRVPVGALYRLWPDGHCEKLFDNLAVSNGCAFSPDGKTFYFADSEMRVRTIWACDYDKDSGAVTNRRVFVDTHDLAGRPDGGTVDADGCYWMAGVSGWQLVRFTPAGKVDMIVPMPVEKPTKIAFGGKDLDTLFVTSIGHGLAADAPVRQPHAGGLFALRVPGVKGLPTWRFAG